MMAKASPIPSARRCSRLIGPLSQKMQIVRLTSGLGAETVVAHNGSDGVEIRLIGPLDVRRKLGERPQRLVFGINPRHPRRPRVVDVVQLDLVALSERQHRVGPKQWRNLAFWNQFGRDLPADSGGHFVDIAQRLVGRVRRAVSLTPGGRVDAWALATLVIVMC